VPRLRHEPLEILGAVGHEALIPGEAPRGVLIASQERQAPPAFQVGSLTELAELGWLQ